MSRSLCWGLLLLGGCETTVKTIIVADAPEPGTALADFRLIDRNTTSPTYDQAVSPNDLRGQVSAWYFGHAT